MVYVTPLTDPPRPSELPIYTIIRPEDEQLYIRVDVDTWADLRRSKTFSQEQADDLFSAYAIVSTPRFFARMLRKRKSQAIKRRLFDNRPGRNNEETE